MSLVSREEQALANIREISERVSEQLAAEWATKSAHEARAFSVFALTLGLSTLYLAVRDQFALADFANDSIFYWALVVSFSASTLSIAAAVVTAWPGAYKRVSPSGLRAAYRHSFEKESELQVTFIPERINQLETMIATNRRKANWAIVSFVLTGLSIVGFGASIYGAFSAKTS